MSTSLSRLAIGPAVLALSLAVTCRAQAVGECRKFGTPAFTADRTVAIGGHTIQSKVVVDGLAEREETVVEGHRQVRLVSPGRIVSYDPDARTGLAQTMRKPPTPPKDAMRIDIADDGGNKVVTVSLRDKTGQFHQLARTTCRSDGVPLTQDFSAPIGGAPVQGIMVLTNVAVGPVDKTLFQLPADIRLKK